MQNSVRIISFTQSAGHVIVFLLLCIISGRKREKRKDYAVPWPHCRPETRALGVFVGDQFRVSWEDSFSMDENRLFGEEGTQGLRSTGAGGFLGAGQGLWCCDMV